MEDRVIKYRLNVFNAEGLKTPSHFFVLIVDIIATFAIYV